MKFLHQSNNIHYFENSNDKREVALQSPSTEVLNKQLSSSWHMKEFENEIQNKEKILKKQRKYKKRDLLI